MRLKTLFLIPVLTWVAGCGNAEVPNPERPAGCGAGVAMIKMGDGYLQRLCGCNETDTSAVFAGTAFVCTISSGAQVQFLFHGGHLPHRVLSTGSPSFPSSTMYDPLIFALPSVHPVDFDTAGTYDFADGFQSNLTGQIVVL